MYSSSTHSSLRKGHGDQRLLAAQDPLIEWSDAHSCWPRRTAKRMLIDHPPKSWASSRTATVRDCPQTLSPRSGWVKGLATPDYYEAV